MTLHLHVRVQTNPHEQRGVLEHPRHVHAVPEAVSIVVVAPVVEEQRIVLVLAESHSGFLRRDGASFAAMAGQARSAVAAERLAFEESSSLEEVEQRPCLGRKGSDTRPGPADVTPCAVCVRNGTLILPRACHHPLVARALESVCAASVTSVSIETEARQNPPTTVIFNRCTGNLHSRVRTRGQVSARLVPTARRPNDDDFKALRDFSDEVYTSIRLVWIAATDPRRSTVHQNTDYKAFHESSASATTSPITARYSRFPIARDRLKRRSTSLARPSR